MDGWTGPQIMFYFLIAYMSITSRMSGGGLGAKYLWKCLPEILFAIPFVCFIYNTTGSLLLSVLAGLWSFFWMETGHGTVLQWGDNPRDAQGERKQFLTPFVNYLSKKIGLEIGGRGYCRLFMAVKGFLIGLPVGGLLLAILWPLAYEIGHKLKLHYLSELLAGAGAGMAIWCLI